MALGDFSLFSWKSKATIQKEQEEYGKWAFPFGQTQRDNLEALLRSINPKESMPTMLIQFLTCKELFEGIVKKSESRDAAVDTMINTQKKYKQILAKKNMTLYLALVLADAEVDESCVYPSADEIRASVQELEKLKR